MKEESEVAVVPKGKLSCFVRFIFEYEYYVIFQRKS